MLAGQPPFLGTTAQEILARHALDPVPPLRTIRPELPQAVEHAVRKALAKSPADRFHGPAAFSEALAQVLAPPSVMRRAGRSIGLVTVGACLLAAGYALLSRRPVGGPSGEAAYPIPSLPFVNIRREPANRPRHGGTDQQLI